MYKKVLHVQSCFFAKGLFTRREEDSSARKILEGVATLRWVYMQRFRSVWCPNIECLEKELKMEGGKNKYAVWALLLSLLALITTFQQN